MDSSFTPIVGENQSSRPSFPHHPSQEEKNKKNRLENASMDPFNFPKSTFGDTEKIDLVVEGTEKTKHFRAIDNDIQEIERQMMADAPKPEEYKLEDIFDQSYKDLMKENSSLVTESISTSSTGDDEFDVY
eukprot:NODE_6048_length_612_cov_54.348135_g5644_i0.p1 GENE.NODE_6048_length_612_cov_54.348135_g5644_i0~~NODE_6048_length_612_cov_54.348135_g5644_i0.p1  ORF type:complete len:131 (+),score=21.60 NODE_6048_length_612_cov_54.348135_g5644_i0:75-467(+)